MKSAKRRATAKSSVKFKDLKSKKNPKGGAFDTYTKILSPREKWVE